MFESLKTKATDRSSGEKESNNVLWFSSTLS